MSVSLVLIVSTDFTGTADNLRIGCISSGVDIGRGPIDLSYSMVNAREIGLILRANDLQLSVIPEFIATTVLRSVQAT